MKKVLSAIAVAGGLALLGGAAFAQWGGVFYIFATVDDPDDFESNSTVRTVDRTTGRYRTIMTHVPYRISGAGVSTCAPERDASNPLQMQGP